MLGSEPGATNMKCLRCGDVNPGFRASRRPARRAASHTISSRICLWLIARRYAPSAPSAWEGSTHDARSEAMKRLILTVLAAATLLAACGGSSSSSGGAYGSGGATSTPKPATAATVKTTAGDLGTFLTDAKGRSLYLWVADKGSTSTCSGGCAQACPPLPTTGKPLAGAGAEASLLGTSKRSDGALEVTFAGHPLYYFAGDAQPGQTTGQGSDGFGAEWFVFAPNGNAITKGQGA